MLYYPIRSEYIFLRLEKLETTEKVGILRKDILANDKNLLHHLLAKASKVAVKQTNAYHLPPSFFPLLKRISPQFHGKLDRKLRFSTD